MASLSTSKDGLRLIMVVIGNTRPKIRLGRIPKKQAETILRRVEHLASCKQSGNSPDNDVAAWLGSLPDGDALLERLVTIGLVAARAKKEEANSKHNLKELIEKFTKLKTPSLADRSVVKLDQSLGKLTEKFGDAKEVESFTVADASAFESWVFECGGSLAYARTLNRYAKQLFDYACDLTWIEVNPCRKLKTTAVAASVRHYVTPEDAKALIDACPTIGWKVIVGLGRYAGLRVPSELFNLNWSDIDFKKKSIRIAEGKTKERVCPIIAEFLPILLEAKRIAEGDAVVETSYSNVRRKIPKIVEKAGLEMWEDSFQTLRRSFETHMVDLGCPAHAVSSWVGHSVKVSEDHYLMVSSDAFGKATKNAKKAI